MIINTPANNDNNNYKNTNNNRFQQLKHKTNKHGRFGIMVFNINNANIIQSLQFKYTNTKY